MVTWSNCRTGGQPEPALREFRDPDGRRFRLNLKTGLTEWEDEKPPRQKADVAQKPQPVSKSADLDDWLKVSDPAAQEVREDLATDLWMGHSEARSKTTDVGKLSVRQAGRMNRRVYGPMFPSCTFDGKRYSNQL